MPDWRKVLEFLPAMRWQDWVDILIVAVIIYQTIRMIRGTRSMQILLGLAIVVGAYAFSARFDLLTLNWILSNFLTYIILILVILFQNDIRRALAQVARISFSRSSPEILSAVNEVVRAAFLMAEKRVGALIAFERDIGLKNYIEAGTPVDARVSEDLLLCLFNTATPLHDGAVIIQEGRIAAAASFLPLSDDEDLVRHFGTRHRAAIGLSRETDAAVVVVSEERGVVSVVHDGQVNVIFNRSELRDKLAGLLSLTVSGEQDEEEEKTVDAAV
ncbi:MAG: diadenylate cyclase CdaA [Thermodesulfobacteriota bacterium]